MDEKKIPNLLCKDRNHYNHETFINKTFMGVCIFTIKLQLYSGDSGISTNNQYNWQISKLFVIHPNTHTYAHTQKYTHTQLEKNEVDKWSDKNDKNEKENDTNDKNDENEVDKHFRESEK